MKAFILIFFAIIISTTTFSQEEKQSLHTFQKDITVTLSANYLLYLPKDYNQTENNFPLVLFLHGAGERGEDIEKVKIHGLPKLINHGKDFPFIVVSPQCPENMLWNTDILSALLDKIESEYRIDLDKVYLTGLSMGGHGTWELAIKEPKRFAAIAPVCGWTDTSKACLIAHIPTWVFHGAKDVVIPVNASVDMVEALKKCGVDPKLTIYPEANHDSWTETYNNEELYKWLMEQSLGKN